MIFNIYIYNKQGVCLYYEEWNRTTPTKNPPEEEQKMLYGLIWAIKNFSQKSSPFPEQEKSGGFQFYKTNSYKLHYFETPSSIKFVLNTDPDVGDLRDVLRNIYKNVFVEYITKNPLYKLGEPIKSELFVENLNKEIRALPYFRTPPRTNPH